MRRLADFFLLVGLALICVSRSEAQTITVQPGNVTLTVGKTVQFTVKVSGLSSPSVTWWAGGVKGGNATAGTISASGLYTAPNTTPGQNPVTITAVSTVKPKVSGTTYAYLISLGPTITSVAPNPVFVGNLTVTIQGSGFQQGAMVYDSYGSNPDVQLITQSVTSTTITAVGYQGAASAATFNVKNPGTDYSNSITVPVSNGSPPTTYALSVVSGSGSGSYTAGTVVTITANAPPSGQQFFNWTGATVQSPTSATTTLAMPAVNTTVTANYTSSSTNYMLSVVNGSGSGTYAPGTVVTITANAPPFGQQFVNWTGATVQNATSATTTLAMPAVNTTVTANYAARAVTIPYPVTTHPRIWITQGDLPRLQSWATASNPIYAQGMVPLLQQAVSAYTTQFFPGGAPNSNYPDPGDTQGYVGLLTEQYGTILAFNSLIDPSPAMRILYAQYARNLLMYALNQAALGPLSGAPFRDPYFAIYNRANGTGEQWPLIVDWIYNARDALGNAILTSSDKATIRNVFMMWANECLNAYTTGGDHPAPIGVMNDPQLLPNNQPYRMASNNYYLGHARLLTMMALSIDPGDDPPVNPGLPGSALGNSLRSYILDANGAWLYQEFAMMGAPAMVGNAYGMPANGAGFGLASGGLPPEGMLYGHSFGFVLGQLLALQTAGFNNPAYSGPQIGLIGAPVWDRYVTGFISSITPTAQVFPAESWLGAVYQFASYGDLLRLYITPDYMQPFALLTLLEQENGQSTHANAARWFSINACEGGANALLTRVTTPWSWSTTQSILYYMLLDPTAPTAIDPRPSYPTTFFDPAAGRVVAHSDWSSANTMFDYRASWISINHQLGDGGQFELFRKGEWLTKEMSNYDNNALGMTTVYHNTLGLQNWCANGTPRLNWYENGEWANGSQWMEGLDGGDPTTVSSSGPGYVYATSDLTNLFNRPDIWTPSNGATDITQATRSILWLNNDYIVVYDRGTSLHSGLFKRFNLSLVNMPAISGNVVTETMASGQQLFVQTLLPVAPSITAVYAAGNLSPIAELEPTRYMLTVQDPTLPSDARFLHVLQGADPGAAMAPATRLQSSSGTAFDGAAFGSTAVYFPVSAAATFAATAFTAPSGVHTLWVTGLTPGAGYSASTQSAGNGTTITVSTGGASASADSAGVLMLTF